MGRFKKDIILWAVFGILLIIPFVTTENSIIACEYCQKLIEFMSYIIPGIHVMSNASVLPQTVALEMSLVWMFVPIMIIYGHIAYIRGEIIIKSRQVRASILFIVMAMNEFWFGLYMNTSTYYGTIGIVNNSHKKDLVNTALQSDFGISLLSFFEVSFQGGLAFAITLIAKSIFESMIKNIKGK